MFATCSPMAMQDVSPGLSMPYRHTRPSIARSRGPAITKSPVPSPGPTTCWHKHSIVTNPVVKPAQQQSQHNRRLCWDCCRSAGGPSPSASHQRTRERARSPLPRASTQRWLSGRHPLFSDPPPSPTPLVPLQATPRPARTFRDLQDPLQGRTGVSSTRVASPLVQCIACSGAMQYSLV